MVLMYSMRNDIVTKSRVVVTVLRPRGLRSDL